MASSRRTGDTANSGEAWKGVFCKAKSLVLSRVLGSGCLWIYLQWALCSLQPCSSFRLYNCTTGCCKSFCPPFKIMAGSWMWPKTCLPAVWPWWVPPFARIPSMWSKCSYKWQRRVAPKQIPSVTWQRWLAWSFGIEGANWGLHRCTMYNVPNLAHEGLRLSIQT